MTSQPGQQTIVIHILPNTSKIKGNQTMKYGQLIECNTRNIFLEKSYTERRKETSLSKYIETRLQTTCFHVILSFLKI